MPPPDETRLEQTLGQLLRAGVLLSALVVLAGGVVFLARHGAEPVERGVFRGEPEDLHSVTGIAAGALGGRGRSLIQLGLLLLIATPVARVAFSAYGFAREGDWTYVVLTLSVLGILLFSLFALPAS